MADRPSRLTQCGDAEQQDEPAGDEEERLVDMPQAVRAFDRDIRHD